MFISRDNAAAPARTIASPARTLWKFGGLLAVWVGTMAIGNSFIPTDKSVSLHALGNDFLVFYYAGNCVVTGHSERLYDLNESRKFERQQGKLNELDIGPAFGPYWNPPFVALFFSPLAHFEYPLALAIWWDFSLCCLVLALVLMCRMLPESGKNRWLVPLYFLVSMPFIMAFGHGQNTFLSLLLLAGAVFLWRSQKPLLAGLVCGLLFYKPQLGALAAAGLCISEGRRAILGVAITGTVLTLVNILVLPGTLHDWFFQMPVNLAYMQEATHYQWERHVTFKGMWHLAIQGRDNGPTAWSVKILWGLTEALFLGGLGMVILKTIRSPRTASSRDRLIAATIVTMPLVMPFYFDYDLLLVGVGAVVYAADRMRNPTTNNWEDIWLMRTFLTLMVVLYFATSLAEHIHMLLTIPLLATASALLIRRGLRPISQALPVAPPVPVLLAA
ncbi:MAG: glycosyltransferase family 87 protein [Tepidisphaeraceae bacterium]|jgi:hypothetical protein